LNSSYQSERITRMASKKVKRQFPKTVYVDWYNGTQDEDDELVLYEDLDTVVDGLDEEEMKLQLVGVYELKYIATVERKIVLTPKK